MEFLIMLILTIISILGFIGCIIYTARNYKEICEMYERHIYRLTEDKESRTEFAKMLKEDLEQRGGIPNDR